jgi:hypothetical protein
MPKKSEKSFVVCLSNDGYSASLEARKIYVALSDAAAARNGLLRVVDESGEDTSTRASGSPRWSCRAGSSRPWPRLAEGSAVWRSLRTEPGVEVCANRRPVAGLGLATECTLGPALHLRGPSSLGIGELVLFPFHNAPTSRSHCRRLGVPDTLDRSAAWLGFATCSTRRFTSR